LTVVTLSELIPIPRYDNKSFTTATIFEGTTSLGPWAQIDVVNLTPDVDPSQPSPRNLTTENASAAEDSWFYVIFGDADGDMMLPTAPIQNERPLELPQYMPTLSEVGALVRARTKDSNGKELGTFSSDTRPTASVVMELVQAAARDIISSVDYDIPVEAWDLVRNVIAHGAAMRVELTLFPEQVRIGRSNYTELKELYDEMLARLVAAVSRESAEEISGETTLSPLMPQGSFPEPTDWMTRKM